MAPDDVKKVPVVGSVSRASQGNDLEAQKARQRTIWSAVDYSTYAHLTPTPLMSERLCDAVELRANDLVLDVATGSGNTAIAATRRWCRVTGIDFVPELLDRARQRAAVEGMEIEFLEGDAENLRFPDGHFDAVLSTLGVMFAPDHAKAASEMLRVVRPGGKIGVASWTPFGMLGQIFRVVAKFVPPPPTSKSPLMWGTEAWVKELFGERVSELRASFKSLIYRHTSPAHFVEWLRMYLNPLTIAYETLDAAGRERLMKETVSVVSRFNRSGDRSLLAPAHYLEVVAVKR